MAPTMPRSRFGQIRAATAIALCAVAGSGFAQVATDGSLGARATLVGPNLSWSVFNELAGRRYGNIPH